jgi:predicted amidohydrolase YtcJ
MIIWTAVNRVSRSGVVVGPEERITALDALRAVTLDAAYQYFEEKRKGSIEVGKLADLVILDKNPLTVAPMAIKDIKVLETIKEGQTVWRA